MDELVPVLEVEAEQELGHRQRPEASEHERALVLRDPVEARPRFGRGGTRTPGAIAE